MKYKYLKRGLDFILALIIIIILLPLCLPIIILLLFTGEHEVFYKQDRVGYQNKIFKIWKFATMLKNSPNLGAKDLTQRNDPRITPMGKFLRKSKLNELPQLINILKGDMSFVGPRPLMKAGFDRYSPEMQSKIYQVKPGLTGVGSVIFRDEELIITQSKLTPQECYKNVILPHKGALEIWYQQHFNLYTDCMIIFLTAWYIISPHSNLAHIIFPTLPQKTIN